MRCSGQSLRRVRVFLYVGHVKIIIQVESSSTLDSMTTFSTTLTKEEALCRVEETGKRRNELLAMFREADREMREAVEVAFALKVPASKMTKPTGLGGARLYQIRDGR